MITYIRTFALTLSSLLLLLSPLALAEDKWPKMPLHFYVFLHDDIPHSKREAIAKDYFAWLRKDLESFTQRRVYVNFLQNTGPTTHFAYQGENLTDILNGWTSVVNDYIDQHNLPMNPRTKYLLLTNAKINEVTLGIARKKQYAAIASLKSYAAAAHELGHLLGGDHEHAEVLFKGGWWCETNLYGARMSLRAPCYEYSDKNKEAIAANLSESP